MVTESEIRAMVPTLTKCADGSWLATSGPGAVLPVGVFGESREDASQRFQGRLEWHVGIFRDYVWGRPDPRDATPNPRWPRVFPPGEQRGLRG